jgi:hypothetical protein
MVGVTLTDQRPGYYHHFSEEEYFFVATFSQLFHPPFNILALVRVLPAPVI